jgi:fibronectin-binding autotransporter adhesin
MPPSISDGGAALLQGLVLGYETRDAYATVNLRSGDLYLADGGIRADAASQPFSRKQVNLYGGTLGALAPWSYDNMNLHLLGPATIDTDDDYQITMTGQLLNPGSGMITKIGAGTLYLNGDIQIDPQTQLDIEEGQVVINGVPYGSSPPSSPLSVTETLSLIDWGFGDSQLRNFPRSARWLVVRGGRIRMEPYPSGQTDPDGRPDYTEAPRAFTLDRPGATLEAAAGVTWRISVYPRADGSDRYPLVSNLAAGQNLTLTGAGTGQIDKVIPGAGGLVKTGSGTWILTGDNTYTGTTTISGGALEIRHANALGATGTDQGTTVSSDATLRLAVPEGTPGITFAAEPLSLAGSGVGGVGALQNAAGTNTWTGAVTLTANTFIGVAGGSQLTISGRIGQSGTTGSLTKIGSGTLVLAGDNTYTGTTEVQVGILEIKSAAALGATSAGTTVSSGATLRLNPSSAITVAEPLTIAGTGVSEMGALYNANASNTWSGPITLSHHTSIGVAAGSQLTISGRIGPLNWWEKWSLTKLGEGTLILSNNTNAYTGGTTVKEGTLRLGITNAIPTGTVVRVEPDGTFDLAGYSQTLEGLRGSGRVTGSGTLTINNGADHHTFDGVLEGNFRLVKTGGYQYYFKLTHANPNYTGTITIQSGTLLITNPGALGSTDVGTIVQGGTLKLETPGNSTMQEPLTLYGTPGVAALWANDDTTWQGSITLAGGQAGIVVANYKTLTIETPISGRGGLVVHEGGTVRLTAANTYEGPTTVRLSNAAHLEIQHPQALGTADGTADTGTTVNPSGRLLLNAPTGGMTIQKEHLTLKGNLWNERGANTWTGPVVVEGNPWISVINDSLTITGQISGSGNLFKYGSGTLVLTAQNTYTGTTTVDTGTLRLGTDNAINPATTMKIGPGTFDMAGYNQTLAGLGIGNSAGYIINSSTTLSTLTYDSSNDSTFAGVIGGGSNNIQLVKKGSGTLTLTRKNTYTGGTRIEAGTLQLSGGNDRLASTGNITITGGVLDLGGNTQNITGSAVVSFQGGTVQNGTINNTSSQPYDGQAGYVSAVLAGSAGLVKTGSGTLTLSGANTYTGGTRIEAGTLQLSGGNDRLNPAGSITITGGVLDLGGTTQNITASPVVSFQGGVVRNGTIIKAGGNYTTHNGNVTVSAVLAGSAGLVKTGSGTWILTGQNTYTGGTRIEAGTLQLSDGNDRLNPAGSITITGGVLDLGGNTQNITGSAVVSFQGGTVQKGTIHNTSTQPYDGQAGTVSAVLAGTAGLVKTGTGTLALSGANTYTGPTEVQAGTLEIKTASALGATGTGQGTTVASGATLRLAVPEGTPGITFAAEPVTLTSYGSPSDGALYNYSGNNTWTGPIILNATSSHTIPIGVNTDTQLTISGIISKEGSYAPILLKVGQGTLVLSGANTYFGNTKIVKGKLLVNNTMGSGTGSSSVEVGAWGGLSGGTLGGFGSIAGDVRIETGKLTAGDVGATLGDNSLQIGGDLTMQSGSTWVVDIFSSSSWDLIDLTGTGKTASFPGPSGSTTLTVNVLGSFVPSSDNPITILKAANITGITIGADGIPTAGIVFNPTGPGSGYSHWRLAIVSLADGRYGLNLWAAPEPSTWLMLLVGGAGLGLLRWYRRRSAGQNR